MSFTSRLYVVFICVFICALIAQLDSLTAYCLSAGVTTLYWFFMRKEHSAIRAQIMRTHEDAVKALQGRKQPQRTGQTWPDVISHTAEKGEQVCQVCLDSAVNTALDPCGHLFCSECLKAMRVQTCPICRETVNRGMRVFVGKVET